MALRAATLSLRSALHAKVGHGSNLVTRRSCRRQRLPDFRSLHRVNTDLQTTDSANLEFRRHLMLCRLPTDRARGQPRARANRWKWWQVDSRMLAQGRHNSKPSPPREKATQRAPGRAGRGGVRGGRVAAASFVDLVDCHRH